LKQSLLRLLQQDLFAPGSSGEQLWEHGLVSRLLADGSLAARTAVQQATRLADGRGWLG
jgi:hypothetical protein